MIQTSVIVQPRRLAAYVHADMVGFSRLVASDDSGTAARLAQVRQALLEPALTRYGGRIANTAGDSLMMEFTSVISAIRFAVEIQSRMPEFDQDAPFGRRIRFRMGIHIGDAIADDESLYGDSVNIAARLQAICPPGDVCVSDVVRQHVKGIDLQFKPLGKVRLKNIDHTIEAFVVRLSGTPRKWPRKLAALAGMVLLMMGGISYWIISNHVTFRPIADAADTFSVAVLPFTNLGNDHSDDYLGDGIAEDLTTDLSHLDGAVVVARESAFAYRGKEVDIRDVGRQLGVHYVLEGSVRKFGDTLRINAQLIGADLGTHVWAERFDQPMRDLREGQDVIVQRIATAVNRKFERNRPTSTVDPTAYDLVLRAKVILQEPRTDVRNIIAAGYFEQALRIDPNSVEAMAGVASMIIETNRSLDRAIALVNRASLVAPDTPDVLAAKVRMLIRETRVGDALETYGHLLDLDSNAASLASVFILCVPCTRVVRPEDLYPQLERTQRLNPLSADRGALYLTLGRLSILLGRDPDAVEWLHRALLVFEKKTPSELAARDPYDALFEATKLHLAAAYALTGQMDDAHRLVWSALSAAKLWTMDISVRWYENMIPIYFDATRRAQEMRLVQGLRLAGLREHLDERADSHIAATRELQLSVNRPTPMTVSGAKTVVTEDVVEQLNGTPLVLTTSDQNPTIPGAILINVPNAGAVTDEWQGALRVLMDRISNGDKNRPIITFAWSMNRWHARNLALRLVALGYTNVHWYRGGWEAWDAHDLPMAPLNVQFLPSR